MKSTNMRSQILDTAQDLIQKLGANAMSYADISEKVGIRKASIHYYFPGKEDLIINVLDRYNDQFCQLFERILASSEPATNKLNRYCNLFVATLSDGEQDKACLCGILGAELNTLQPAVVNRISQFYQNNEIFIEKVLQSGIDSGEFSFVGNPRTMSKLIFSLLEGDLIIARADRGVERIKETIAQMMDLIHS